jgi:hypothetical protein
MLVGLVAIGIWLTRNDPPPTPDPEPIAVAPVPLPEPPPEPIAAVEPLPEPVPEPEPVAAPTTGPRPGPRQPKPGPKPAPVQVPLPSPIAVAPAPAPAPVAPRADVATVYIKYKNSKDPTAPYTRNAKLKDRVGKTYSPGEIPAGSYTVLAAFESQGAAPVGTITVTAGEIRTVWCDEKKILCK